MRAIFLILLTINLTSAAWAGDKNQSGADFMNQYAKKHGSNESPFDYNFALNKRGCVAYFPSQFPGVPKGTVMLGIDIFDLTDTSVELVMSVADKNAQVSIPAWNKSLAGENEQEALSVKKDGIRSEISGNLITEDGVEIEFSGTYNSRNDTLVLTNAADEITELSCK
jgi:hypothetical protein